MLKLNVRTFYALLSILFLLLLAFWYFFDFRRTVSQPFDKNKKEAVLTKLLGRSPQLSAIPRDSSWRKYKGHAISFSYPGYANVIKDITTSDQILDNFSYQINDEHMRVTIQAVKIENISSLEEYAPIKIRDPQQGYLQSPTELNKVSGIEILRLGDNVEHSFFYLKNNIIFSFVFTGPDLAVIKQTSDKTLATSSFLQ